MRGSVIGEIISYTQGQRLVIVKAYLAAEPS